MVANSFRVGIRPMIITDVCVLIRDSPRLGKNDFDI